MKRQLNDQHIGQTFRVLAAGERVAVITVTDILFDRIVRGTDEHGDIRSFDMTDNTEAFRFDAI